MSSHHKQRAPTPPGAAPVNTPVYGELRHRLEVNGVPIETLDEVAADPYIRIEDSADQRAVEILTAAIVLRSFPELLSDTGQIQVLDSDARRRVGYAYVSLDWIRAYREGEITAIEYAKRVLETWQSFDGGRTSTDTDTNTRSGSRGDADR